MGEGAGLGRIVNVPLPAAADDAVYRLAFDEVVLPALRRFQPELVLVSAGFDAHARDPLASMQLTEAGYGWMAPRAARGRRRERRRPRSALVLEGGYDLTALEESTAASLRGALGWEVGEVTGEVPARHREAVEEARRGARILSAP